MVVGPASSLPSAMTSDLLDRVLEPIYSDWFRTHVSGAEHIPPTGGALVVANHAGAFAIDGLITMSAVARNTHRTLRVLGADFLFHLGMNELLDHLGVVPAQPEVARELLANGELVGVWPEGVRGVAKTFDQRYRLQRFGRGGFARVAAEMAVPVIPTAIIGSEESYPLIARMSGVLNWVGLPYLPVTPTFPALGPLGLIPLPSKWSITFGAPLNPPPDNSTIAAFEFADAVHSIMTDMLRSGLEKRTSIF